MGRRHAKGKSNLKTIPTATSVWDSYRDFTALFERLHPSNHMRAGADAEALQDDGLLHTVLGSKRTTGVAIDVDVFFLYFYPRSVVFPSSSPEAWRW